jgi:hypothetical protein
VGPVLLWVIRAITLEVTTLVLAGLSFVAGTVAAIAAIYAVRYSREQLKLGREQLRQGHEQLGLAREQLEVARKQAELRPELNISLQDDEPLTYEPLGISFAEHYNAYVVFQITNSGKTAAHNVVCKFWFDEGSLEPVDYRDFFTGWIGPDSTNQHTVKVRTHSPGSTLVEYASICDEIGRVEGTLRLEVAE